MLHATWSQLPSYGPPNDAGDVQLTLSAGGSSFSDQWWYGSWGNRDSWNGTCTSS
jgi:hypothetical protein